MSWASRLAGLLETSTFRHASLTAFIFLLVALGSVMLSSHQVEMLLQAHVRDMILADVQNQDRRNRLKSAERLAEALSNEDGREREGGMSLVLSNQGVPLYGNEHLKRVLDCASQCVFGWRNEELISANGNPIRTMGLQVPLEDGGVFLSAYNILPMLERVRVIPLIAGVSLLAMLLSSLAIGLYSSMRSMRRVERIRSALRRYVGGDQHVTVPVNSHGDEFDLLSGDINHVLGRVNGLMDEAKSVSSILAHELRTPLTRLHNRLAGVAERLDADLRNDILEAATEAERIQRIFKAVLRIGEVEAGRCAYFFEWFDARALLDEVADYYHPLVEDAGIGLVIDCAAEGDIFGDRPLLFQAIANLLENAIKYGAASSLVLLLRQQGNCIELGVADNGPGIPADLRGEAVRRFRRLGTPSQQGFGLGLTLVNAIAKLHTSELLLSDNHPCGLLAVLRMSRSNWSLKAGLVEVLKH